MVRQTKQPSASANGADTAPAAAAASSSVATAGRPPSAALSLKRASAGALLAPIPQKPTSARKSIAPATAASTSSAADPLGIRAAVGAKSMSTPPPAAPSPPLEPRPPTSGAPASLKPHGHRPKIAAPPISAVANAAEAAEGTPGRRPAPPPTPPSSKPPPAPAFRPHPPPSTPPSYAAPHRVASEPAIGASTAAAAGEGEAVALSFRLGDGGFEFLSYGARAGDDGADDGDGPGERGRAASAGGATSTSISAAAAGAHAAHAGTISTSAGPPRGLIAALQRVELDPKAAARGGVGAGAAADDAFMSPESKGAFERMYARFRATADKSPGGVGEDPEDEEEAGGLSLAEVVGAAGFGFGRGLESIFSRWGDAGADPLQAALQEAEVECSQRRAERAAERRRRAEEGRRRAAAMGMHMGGAAVVELGAGAWAR